MAATVIELWPGASEGARPEPVTVAVAVQQFLAQAQGPEPASPDRAEAAVLHTLAELLGSSRPLAEITERELVASLRRLWAAARPRSWNHNRTAVGRWLAWCVNQPHWVAPILPPTYAPEE